MDNRPIGIFDSGQGGLTVVRELMRTMPNESIVYFGDTSRVPYGTKSTATITKYARQDIEFLKTRDVKMIIAACGTVSAILPKEVSQNHGLPYTGVVLPTAKTACKKTKTKHIGVLGTPATIKSKAYAKEIMKIIPDSKVTGIACPMFVPLVENGYTQKDNQVAKFIANEYLSPLNDTDIDVLILGCTHFPLLKPVISSVLKSNIELIDAGFETAHFAKKILTKENLLADENSSSQEFFVSDDTENFKRGAVSFLGQDLSTPPIKVVIA